MASSLGFGVLNFGRAELGFAEQNLGFGLAEL